MSKSKNIFDMTDLSDLPEDIVSQVGIGRGVGLNLYEKILFLFNFKRVLSSDELIVGLSREYGVCVKRRTLHTYIYELKKKNLIEKVTANTFQRKIENCGV